VGGQAGCRNPVRPGFGHCVTLARSRSLWGTYEACPSNPVSIQADPSSPIQRSGHDCPVDAPAGDWWMLYLCGRMNGGLWREVGRTEDASFLSDEGGPEGKRHTGTMVGLFAGRGGADDSPPAYFDWFDYRPMSAEDRA